jgi:transposase-like protein
MVERRIPKLRKGSYFPAKGWCCSVSTRLVKAMGMTGISKSQVSRCAWD